MDYENTVRSAGFAASMPALRPRFDHVAFAAPRIRDLLPLYQDLLGGQFKLGGDNTHAGYRGVQLIYNDGRIIELLEPLSGSSFFDRFFARTGGGGFHHAAFAVDDIVAALHVIGQSGYTATAVSLNNPARREAFLHPRQTCGALIQIFQTDGSDPGASQGLHDVLSGASPFGNGIPSP